MLREREREQLDRPETDWTQCLSPGGTLDDPMTKMQTSTEKKQQSARKNEMTFNSKQGDSTRQVCARV
jgi:hypothetical protein